MNPATPAPEDRSPHVETGIPGLDDVLAGGFTRDRLYVVEGVPGSGKTTLAMQFSLAGAARGERVLYVSLSESAEELEEVAISHGWTLGGVEVHELVSGEASLQPAEHYTVFHPAEVELGQTTDAILREVDRVRPARVVIDSLSELRLLAANPLRYRRQILALKQFFRGRGCTVLMLDDLAVDRDLQVQSIAHGVINLEQMLPEYGGERRRLRVVKHRGRAVRGGHHDYVVRRGGLDVYPRLVAAEHRVQVEPTRMSSGVAALDDLMGGGIPRGTSTLVLGAAGTGKSSIATQFVAAAAARGESSALFLFDEALPTLLARSAALGMDLRPHLESGLVTIRQIDPAEMSPGEMIHAIRDAVDRRGVSLVVLDSLNGYLNAMPAEKHLVIQLHEMLMYLGQRGVATILVAAQHGLVGQAMGSAVDASYLTDAVVLLRYYEHGGELRRVISTIKCRSGDHERTIREFGMDGRIVIGPPLSGFRGIFTGMPVRDES